MLPSLGSRVRVVLLALVLALLGAGVVPGVAPSPAAAAAEDDTARLEQEQAEAGASTAPDVIAPVEQASPGPVETATAAPTGAANVRRLAAAAPAPADTTTGGPTGLKVNHLDYATAADRSALTFSWSLSHAQSSYRIDVFQRKDSATPVATTGTIRSDAQTSVTAPALAAALEDNRLYYWRVTSTDSSGTSRVSVRAPFVTAVGSQLRSTSLVWTPTTSVSNLMRAKVTVPSAPEKVVLTATALDTEASRRHVFNVYVNGTEVGVGPERRARNAVSYNAYDVTSAMKVDLNVVGLFSYSQAATSGVLVQLTAFYADGSSSILYNSAADRTRTQIAAMDEVVYGTSGTSIGTGYYTELAQNVDTTKFPYGWQDASALSGTTGWATPALVAMPAGWTLTPALAGSAVRTAVAPSSVTRNADGSWTVAFAKEVIGDVRLTATASTRTAVRVHLGEELSGGKAVSSMRTGNHYDETWTFRGTDVTFSGFSLKGFWYVTISNYPGTLTASRVSALQTSIPTGLTGSLTSSSSLLQDVVELGRTSVAATASDSIDDSVTRERRPYEGDLLVVQPLVYALGGDEMSVRATWRWLLANPSQYTEYRLMTAIGVRDDYLRAGDASYVRSVCTRVRSQVEATVALDRTSGLVASTGTTDLVDWPRSELPGYDVDGTRYKTVVTVFAVAAYEALGGLASAAGVAGDAATYRARAASLKASVIARLHDAKRGVYVDGLTASRTPVSHAVAQNAYVALAYGVYADDAMVRSLVAPARRAGAQTAGSIYMAFFFYRGLYRSGNGDLANAVLTRTEAADVRTYSHVLLSLKATIAPEAWTVSSKPNTTFSHPWGGRWRRSGAPAGRWCP